MPLMFGHDGVSMRRTIGANVRHGRIKIVDHTHRQYRRQIFFVPVVICGLRDRRMKRARALATARPSHLHDPRLFDFAGLAPGDRGESDDGVVGTGTLIQLSRRVDDSVPLLTATQEGS